MDAQNQPLARQKVSGTFPTKGVGETPIVPVAGAIANAVARATGARVTSLPITPEKVLRALE